MYELNDMFANIGQEFPIKVVQSHIIWYKIVKRS